MTVVVYTVEVDEDLIFASADFCEARRQARLASRFYGIEAVMSSWLPGMDDAYALVIVKDTPGSIDVFDRGATAREVLWSYRLDDGSMWPRWFREIDGTYTQILKGAR